VVEGGKKRKVPQILRGASSSKRLGWLEKISLETRQSCLISGSESCTCLPGLPLTSSSLLMIPSRTARSIRSLRFQKSIKERKEQSERKGKEKR